MSYIKKILVVIAILGLVFCGVKVYDIVQIFSGSNTGFNNEKAYVYIPTETDANILKDELFPLLKDEVSFKVVAKKLGYTKAKAGKYTIKKDMSNLEIVRTLQAKSDLIKVVIPNTNDADVIAKQVSNQIEANEDDLLVFMNDSLYMSEKKIKFETLYKSGTYQIPWNTSAEEFRSIIFKSYEKRKKAQ
ncbi:endolytic transglycosylase MltG [Kordia sp.]|uniref:endolytic transglycosylase MltG n=1 Tax=Kordia sp. TaxID=1965332 RepID=UPI003D294186